MKTIMITVFLLLSTLAQAATPITEIAKPVQCADFRAMIEILGRAPYNERPVWIGNDGRDASKYVLFANAKTGTWTLIQFGSEVGCILGAGVASTVMDPGLKL